MAGAIPPEPKFASFLTAKVYSGILVAAILATLGQGVLPWRDFAVFRTLFLEHKQGQGHIPTMDKVSSIEQYIAADDALVKAMDRRLGRMETSLTRLYLKFDILIEKVNTPHAERL